MILPYFDYVVIIYGSANNENVEKLQRLQNKALKTALLVERRTSSKEIHHRALLNLVSSLTEDQLIFDLYVPQEI